MRSAGNGDRIVGVTLAGNPIMERQAAFTLIELLVVVAIIALLMSILLPSLQQAREQAKGVLCLSNVKGQSLALMMYASEHAGWIPPVIGNANCQWPPWYRYLVRHWRGMEGDAWTPFATGDTPQARQWPGADTDYAANRDIFRCPSVRPLNKWGVPVYSYGMNSRMTDGAAAKAYTLPVETINPAHVPPNPGARYWNINRTFRPGEMYLVAETLDGRYLDYPANPNTRVHPAFKHLGKASLMSHDGHVDRLTAETFQTGFRGWGRLPWFNER